MMSLTVSMPAKPGFAAGIADRGGEVDAELEGFSSAMVSEEASDEVVVVAAGAEAGSANSAVGSLGS